MSRSTKNYLRHIYDEIHYLIGIDYDIVWDVIDNHLNPLDEAVKSLLSRNDID